MRFGARIPNFSKMFSARTTGRANRALKRLINPYYGRKGAGFIRDPKRAMYNMIYYRTTFGFFDAFKIINKSPKKTGKKVHLRNEVLSKYGLPKESFQYTLTQELTNKKWGVIQLLLAALVGYITFNYKGALICSVLMIIAVIAHNNKPATETRPVTIKLEGDQINDLIVGIGKKVNATNKKIHKMDESLSPNEFFENFSSISGDIKEIEDLMVYYNIPSNCSNTNDLEGALQDSKTEDINKFINRYYKEEENSASKLKTEKGYKSRLDKKKNELLFYQDFMSQDHIELINRLWDSSKYNKIL